VFNLHDIPQEKEGGESYESQSWPEKGHISFQNVDLRYRPNTELALVGISFEIKAG